MKNAVIILAAGKGTRMQSDIPKVLHKLKGKTLLERVIITSNKLLCKKIIVVIGYKKEILKNELKKFENVEYAIQREQNGTAHAVKMCFENLNNFEGNVIILSGDVPLISDKTLMGLLNAKINTNSKASVLTSIVDNPAGYGRIVRNTSGNLNKITEHKDCNEKELRINEINAGIYVIENKYLKKYIPKIKNNNSQSEYYLPDLINLMIRDSIPVSIFKTINYKEICGVNSKEQLTELEKFIND